MTNCNRYRVQYLAVRRQRPCGRDWRKLGKPRQLRQMDSLNHHNKGWYGWKPLRSNLLIQDEGSATGFLGNHVSKRLEVARTAVDCQYCSADYRVDGYSYCLQTP